MEQHQKHTAAPVFSLNSVLSAAGETAYYWDLASDRIVWAPNAPSILQIADTELLRTGYGFEKLITHGLETSRREAIQKSGISNSLKPGNAQHTPSELENEIFTVQYSVSRSSSGEQIWLEDHGRITTGKDGTAAIVKGVIRIITERYGREQKLSFLSRHDHLTGQINRGELWEAISDAFITCRDMETSFGFLIVGINNLLMINEAFGFDTGDEVIAEVAKRLSSKLRDTDVIGRFSSNKFGLLLEEGSPTALAAAAERLLRVIRDQVIETSLGPVAVTISIGGVLLPQQAENVSEAIGNALEALAKAKAKPHDLFMPYSSLENKKEARKRNREIADELVEAIRDHRLLLALQPIVRSDTLEPSIHECLLRIRKKDGSIVSGGNYIPVAEQLGLIRLVDYRVLELAIEVAHRQPDLTLTINVSGLTATDKNWLELLTSLTDGDLSLTRRLIIEITETAAIQDIEESCRFVKYIKALGCRVAMDDFGTGYNSFRNLQTLGLDMVKIDGSFIENMHQNKDDQLFVKLLADLARQFNLEIVAECVGDDLTTTMLKEAGITYLQGYHFGQPQLAMPEDEVFEGDL